MTLPITPHLAIPLDELEFDAMSGQGPGGQHVNRSATRISLRWNVRTSPALSDAQRTRLLNVLGSRIDSDGAIRIVAGEYRSQMQNRNAALERLSEVVARALVIPKQRKATKPTRSSIEKRLTEKKRRSSSKRDRKSGGDDWG